MEESGWAPVVGLGVSFFFLGAVIRAIAKGSITLRGGEVVERLDEPVLFWLAISWLMAIGLVVFGMCASELAVRYIPALASADWPF